MGETLVPPDPARLAELAEQLRRIADELLSETIAPHAGVLPPDWWPHADLVVEASGRYPGLDLAHEIEHFRHYHLARGTRYLSWDKAFLGWLAKSAEFQRRDRGTQRATARTTRAEQTTAENDRRSRDALSRFDEVPDPAPPRHR